MPTSLDLPGLRSHERGPFLIELRFAQMTQGIRTGGGSCRSPRSTAKSRTDRTGRTIRHTYLRHPLIGDVVVLPRYPQRAVLDAHFKHGYWLMRESIVQEDDSPW